MPDKNYDIGMIGLGVMGRNFVLDIADHGYSVSGYDTDLAKTRDLRTEAGDRAISAVQSLEELVRQLSMPRTIMMLVPAGPPVDAVIHELTPLLERGDLIVDLGNSHFSDTDARGTALAEQGLLYMGVGISGGEAGA